VTQYATEVRDLGVDYNGFNSVYEAGASREGRGYAIAIETDQGVTGEYAGGDGPTYAQVNLFAPYLLGRDALQRVTAEDLALVLFAERPVPRHQGVLLLFAHLSVQLLIDMDQQRVPHLVSPLSYQSTSTAPVIMTSGEIHEIDRDEGTKIDVLDLLWFEASAARYGDVPPPTNAQASTI